jgi:hypothetical protein
MREIYYEKNIELIIHSIIISSFVGSIYETKCPGASLAGMQYAWRESQKFGEFTASQAYGDS